MLPFIGFDSYNNRITDVLLEHGRTFTDILDVKGSCRVATTQAFSAETWGTTGVIYDNVAGTITQNDATEGVLGTIDGVALIVGDRLLIKNEGVLTTNGIYTVQALGDGLTNPVVFKRAKDSDHSTEVSAGNMVFIETGTINAGSQFALTGEGELELGVDDIVWNLFGGASSGLTDILVDSVGSNGGTGVNILTHNSIEPADPLYSGYVNSQIGGATNPYQEVNAYTIHMRRFLQNATWRDGQIYLYSNDPANPNPTIGLYGGSSEYPGYVACHRLRANYLSANTSSVVIVDTDLACKIGSPIQSSLRFGEDFANGFYQATPFSISYSNGTEEKVRFADGLNIQNSRFNKMGIYFGVDNPTLTGIFQETANTFGFASNGVTRLSIGNNDDVEISNSPLKLFAGNIGAPSLSWGDTTTGFYKSGTNQVAITVSGTQRLRISASGALITGGLTLTSGSTLGLQGSSSTHYVNGTLTAFYGETVGTRKFQFYNNTTLTIELDPITNSCWKVGPSDWIITSDPSIKMILSRIDIEESLTKINNIDFITYKWKEGIEGFNSNEIWDGVITTPIDHPTLGHIRGYYDAFGDLPEDIPTREFMINGVEETKQLLDSGRLKFHVPNSIKALKARDEAKQTLIDNMTTVINAQAQALTDLIARVESLEAL